MNLTSMEKNDENFERTKKLKDAAYGKLDALIKMGTARKNIQIRRTAADAFTIFFYNRAAYLVGYNDESEVVIRYIGQ